MKRKLILLAMIVALLFTVAGCSKDKENSKKELKEMEIGPYQMDEREKAIFDMVSTENQGNIYEYKTNDEVKYIRISFDKLNKNGKWEAQTSTSGEIQDMEGKRFIGYDSLTGSVTMGGATSIVKINANKNDLFGKVWLNDNKTIEKNKSIPVMMEVFSDKGGMTIEDNILDNYYKPKELLKKYNNVFAITVTFSDKKLE